MISLCFLLRCVAALSALPLSEAAPSYYVNMIWATSMDDYISVINSHTIFDDVAYGEDFETGRLPRFPDCRSTTSSQEYMYPLTVNVDTGFPFQVDQTYPTQPSSVRPIKELMGEWSADVFWGDFEGADFDPEGTRYSWYRVMDRKFRIVGNGRWCRGGVPIPVPSSVEVIGGGRDTSIRIDPAELEGVNATFAIRFNYFDMDRDLNHPNYSDPTDVSTSCFRVQFTSSRDGARRSCTAGDNGGDTQAEALAIAGITPTGVQSTATSTRTSTTSTYTGVAWTPHARPDESEAPQVNGKHVGAGVGAGFGLIVILYIFFKYASEPYQSGTQGGESSVVRESSLLADYRALAETNGPTSTSGTAVRGAATDGVRQPPPIYEPPPRYEDINAGQPRPA
ncbi:hypothetical protein F5X68DRAFT_260358 [Plectosphaerella plurivora]|uniref:Uncharacterized protein n=1 Tax=Plectosphaerella plurivora TaxID=936078 RepID=A0A9P9ACQ1_9PEZI|nr:hypothetical protein F5X68DRAFT_260358 [Plectosphaerella plurivora]